MTIEENVFTNTTADSESVEIVEVEQYDFLYIGPQQIEKEKARENRESRDCRTNVHRTIMRTR